MYNIWSLRVYFEFKHIHLVKALGLEVIECNNHVSVTNKHSHICDIHLKGMLGNMQTRLYNLQCCPSPHKNTPHVLFPNIKNV